MATSAVYSLVVNEGARDKWFTASDLLDLRLRKIKRDRCPCGSMQCDSTKPACRKKTSVDLYIHDIEKTHIFFMRNNFRPYVNLAFEYQLAQLESGIIDFGNTLTYSIPQFGDFFSDMVFHIKMEGLAALDPTDKVYCCDFLGHRLMEETSFRIDQNPLDKYNSDIMMFHYNYFVKSDKKRSWLRCVGQEVPEPAVVNLNMPDGIEQVRETRYLNYGYQTPKAAHPTIDLWIPLIFWFNKEHSFAMPSVAIAWGQRFIDIKLAAASKLFASVGSLSFSMPGIIKAELYVNNIFVAKEVQDIFIKSVGKQMIRVYLSQTTGANQARFEVRLDGMKFYIEDLYCGVRPLVNKVGPNNFTDWYRFYNVETQDIPFPIANINAAPPPLYTLAYNTATLRRYDPTIIDLGVSNRGIEIYQQKEEGFYSAYVPTRFGEGTITAPEDLGMVMIPFNLYPNRDQPSGYFNFSRARLSYINVNSTLTLANPGEIVVVGIGLNFLIVSHETAALRYAL